MNILITGANGFIAKHLIEKIIKKHKLYFLVNGSEYDFTGNKAIVNLLNQEQVESFLAEDIKIDIVVHTASKMANQKNIRNISLFLENITIYKNLVLIINYFNPKKVINLSSIAVYPNKDGEYFENSEIKPSVNNDGLYGLSKFCGENMLDLCCNDANITHLRISQVHSEKMREDRIFEVMKKELRQKNIITVYGNCKRVSNFIKIDILISKILFFMDNSATGVFNVGDENLCYQDLALRIIKKYGDSQSVIRCIDKGESSKLLINTDKLTRLEVLSGL